MSEKWVDQTILLFAFRYALERHSYAPGLVRQKLEEEWEEMNVLQRNTILGEIEEHLEMSRGADMDPIDMYDLNDWEKWAEKMRGIV